MFLYLQNTIRFVSENMKMFSLYFYQLNKSPSNLTNYTFSFLLARSDPIRPRSQKHAGLLLGVPRYDVQTVNGLGSLEELGSLPGLLKMVSPDLPCWLREIGAAGLGSPDGLMVALHDALLLQGDSDLGRTCWVDSSQNVLRRI